jgi:phenylalanyl-tRNA synthetase alpha chain
MADIELGSAEKKVLLLLAKHGGSTTSDELANRNDFQSPEEARNAVSWLAQKGLVKIDEKRITFYSLSPEGERYARHGLPEKRLLALQLGKNISEPLTDDEKKIAAIWLKKKGFAEVSKNKNTGELQVVLTDVGRHFGQRTDSTLDEVILMTLLVKETPAGELNPDALAMLKSRKGVLKSRDAVGRTITITQSGKELVEKGLDIDADEISQLTPEHIQTGKWREIKLRKYHVDSYAPAVHGGRKHPLRELMDEVKTVFVEMGFTEIEYDYVQPCFWNMDALFIPQDHPARDIQDTFYLKSPARMEINDEKLAEKIKAVHENGGGTGSEGWRYKGSETEAERTVLRTHTTVNTIRYLSEHPDPPVKVFSVGRIFRNEATDATHLTELHQIEGIVMEEGASLAMLIGTLKEFYKRMGFPDVLVTTSYYPYTEPSMDVAVRFKGRILELGGCGVFRPEVTAPFGVKHQDRKSTRLNSSHPD